MARRDDADAVRQNLIAVAMSDGAISVTPLTSFGLSGSVGSAATRSHSTRSADCARADECMNSVVSTNRTTLQAIDTVRDRLVMIPTPDPRCEDEDSKMAAARQQAQGHRYAHRKN